MAARTEHPIFFGYEMPEEKDVNPLYQRDHAFRRSKTSV
jgi:hypothetical protein